MSLAVFDISKCVENGMIIEPVHDNTTGTIRYVECATILFSESFNNLCLTVTPRISNVLLDLAHKRQCL